MESACYLISRNVVFLSFLECGIFASCDERGFCKVVVSFHSDISFTYDSYGRYVAFSYALQLYANVIFKNISTTSDLVQQIGVGVF